MVHLIILCNKFVMIQAIHMVSMTYHPSFLLLTYNLVDINVDIIQHAGQAIVVICNVSSIGNNRQQQHFHSIATPSIGNKENLISSSSCMYRRMRHYSFLFNFKCKIYVQNCYLLPSGKRITITS